MLLHKLDVGVLPSWKSLWQVRFALLIASILSVRHIRYGNSIGVDSSRYLPAVENVSFGKLMRTKLKVGGASRGDAGSILLDNELSLVENVSRLFRSKYKPVRELSDIEFLSLFDIPAVNTLLNSGFNLRSTSALLEHFRNRVATGWLAAPTYLGDLGFNTEHCSDEELIARADQVLNYDLEWSGVPPELSCGGEIDWHKNILNNREWLARLNRHSWWPLLGHAYQRSGDEKYAMAFARQMSTWVAHLDHCDSSEESIWSCRQVALRLRVSWIPAFGLFFDSPYFNNARKLEMMRTIFDQARYLKGQKTRDNLVINGGLVSVGITFPELRESKGWRKAAVDRCWSSIGPSANRASNPELSHSSNLLAFSDRELATAC